METITSENGMKTICAILLILLLISCEKPQTYQVQHYGSLRSMMHGRDISSKIQLADLEDKTNLYALGAIGNLKGEILVLGGRPYISSVTGDSLRVVNNFDAGAALLVYTRVENWDEMDIPETIGGEEDFEAFLQEVATKRGTDSSGVLPFRIQGTLRHGEWHVIDWKDGDNEHTPEKHKNSGMRGAFENDPVEILGFYSTKHQGIFTHMSGTTHMHVVTPAGEVAAHLDAFTLGKSRLLVPGG